MIATPSPGDRRSCPVCDSNSFTRLDQRGLPPEASLPQPYATCGSCGSVWACSRPIIDYSLPHGDALDRSYLECHAGLSSFAALLQPLAALHPRSLLDVGCGPGFILDMACRRLGITDLLGIEPSATAASRTFDHPVVAGEFPRGLPDPDRTYQVVTASEVLEHVPDPRTFLAALMAAVSEGGVLALSTPNADAIPLEPPSIRWGLLAGGLHDVLLSERALLQLGDDLDLHVKLATWGGESGRANLVMYASRSTRAMSALVPLTPSERRVTDFLLGYLSDRVRHMGPSMTDESPPRTRWLYLGFLARLVEGLVNAGDFRAAVPHALELRRASRDLAGHDLDRPLDLARRIETLADASFDELLEAYHPYLSRCLHFLGILEVSHFGDRSAARPLLEGARRILEIESRHPAMYGNVPLLVETRRNLELLSPGLTSAPSTPTASIVLPLRDGGRWIRGALASVAGQTREDWELLVVDDGSTDDGPTIVAAAAAADPRVILISPGTPPRGQSAARNQGATRARGRYLAFLDQDDEFLPAKLERQIAHLTAHPDSAGVYSDVNVIDEDGRVITRSALTSGQPPVPSVPHPKSALAQCLVADMFILPGATLLRRDCFESAGGFDENLSGYEDDDLFLRILGRAPLDFLSEPLLLWRIRPGSCSTSQSMDTSRLRYLRKLLRDFPDQPSLKLYWATEVTIPRFCRAYLSEMYHARRAGDLERFHRLSADFATIPDRPLVTRLAAWVLSPFVPLAFFRLGLRLRSLVSSRR